MAAVNCNYSGEPVYTKWYDSSSRGYLDITGVSYETTNGRYTISWSLKLGDNGNGRYNFAAAAAWIDGSEVNFTHGADSYTTYWFYNQWSNGSTVASGTFTTTKTSVSLSVKAMFDGGYTSARWNNNQYCVSGSGTLSIVAPTIGSPSVSFSTVSRDRTNITASISASAGTNGGNVSVSTTLNNGSAKTGTSPSWSGLTPNTSYTLRATATNSAGLTATSSKTVTTTGNAPTITRVDWAVSRTVIIFEPKVSYDTNASFSSYSIKYGKSTSYGSTSTGTTISGLTPNTTYYYSITATDNWGRTSAAKTGSFKTNGNDPTINSHGVKTYAQTSMEMQYSASYDTNDSLSSYKWEYGTSTSYGSSVTGTNTISGLSVNTTYYYKLTVTGIQGRSSTATGSFKTDPATVSINSLGFSDITETSVKITYHFNNPSGLSSVYVINTNISAEGVGGQNNQTNFAPIPFSQTVTDLVPGTKYTCMVRVGIRGQGGTIYYSDWTNGEFETLANTPFAKIDSNNTIKYYKGYALGKSDIYNGYDSEWKNGNYSETIGSSISFDGEGMGVSKVRHIEIMGGSSYTYEFPIEQFISSPSVTLILTNSSDIVKKVVKVMPGQSDSVNTGDSTRLYINCTGADLNQETARYIRFSIYRSLKKVLLDKESIVTLNNKIRYIDISQNGYRKGTTTGSDGKIVELDVYDKLGNNIALNKNVTAERGSGSNLEKITDGNHGGTSYCTLDRSVSGTTIRVDLGQEYSYDQIDRVVLWRDVDCIYQESRLLGLDASKQITWKFQSYKSEGVYKETSEGYTARPRKAKTKHNIYITSLLNELDSPPFADKITINADWDISIPPVITDLTTHRVDAIIAANSGRLLKNDVGDLTALTTTEKSNLVDAINEIWNGINKTEEEFTVLDFVLESILCD